MRRWRGCGTRQLLLGLSLVRHDSLDGKTHVVAAHAYLGLSAGSDRLRNRSAHGMESRVPMILEGATWSRPYLEVIAVALLGFCMGIVALSLPPYQHAVTPTT